MGAEDERSSISEEMARQIAKREDCLEEQAVSLKILDVANSIQESNISKQAQTIIHHSSIKLKKAKHGNK